MDFDVWMTHMRQRFEGDLDGALVASPRTEPRLLEAMRYVALGGGKRIRPLLAYAAAESVETATEPVRPFAVALECVHAYSLVHDDLPAMDDDALRRGRPTCHIAFDEATAILAGDALHTFAFHHLLSATHDATRARALGLRLARASGTEGMVSGQMRDLAAEKHPPDAEALTLIHTQKTAALIAAATAGGAEAMGADDATVQRLETFGVALGFGFQIVDDILDATASAEALGKTPGKDAAQDKLSAVRLLGLDGARARAKALHDEALDALAPLERRGRLEGLARLLLRRTA